jgi:hypothetical protein
VEVITMPGRSRKKSPGSKPKAGPDAGQKAGNPSSEDRPAAGANAPRSRGLPAPESIVGETEFTSPKGGKYRIIHTNEMDPSEEPKRPSTRRKKKSGGERKED